MTGMLKNIFDIYGLLPSLGISYCLIWNLFLTGTSVFHKHILFAKLNQWRKIEIQKVQLLILDLTAFFLCTLLRLTSRWNAFLFLRTLNYALGSLFEFDNCRNSLIKECCKLHCTLSKLTNFVAVCRREFGWKNIAPNGMLSYQLLSIDGYKWHRKQVSWVYPQQLA